VPPGDQYRKERVDHLNATVSLELPADPESIAVVRAVVASVASRLALPYDAVDDLRIAAAEASAVLLSAGTEGTRLRVALQQSDAELHLTIWVEGAGPAPGLARSERLAWKVLEGLTDEAGMREVDGSPAIELRLRTVPQ
jgi:serine/threonine-protein kinase RsbW